MHLTAADANAGVVGALGERDAAHHLRRLRGSPRRLHGPAVRPQPVPEAVRADAQDLRRRAPGRRVVRHRLRHDRRQRRAVHVPLLGERHDAAAAQGAVDEEARSSSPRPTPARVSIRPRSSRRSTARRPPRSTAPPRRRSRSPRRAAGTRSFSASPTTRRRRTWRTCRRSFPNTATLRAVRRLCASRASRSGRTSADSPDHARRPAGTPSGSDSVSTTRR